MVDLVDREGNKILVKDIPSIEKVIKRGTSNLSRDSKSLLKRMLSEYVETGDAKSGRLYKELIRQDYLREPVGPKEFLDEDYFVGKFAGGLYPENRELLLEVLDPNSEITELICEGSIGWVKTSIAVMCLVYRLYRLSCLRNPSEFFGLMGAVSRIAFGIYSVFVHRTDKAYVALRNVVDGSPYFQEHFPSLKPKTMEFPNNIVIMQGSSELSALGDDLLTIVMDEVNFMREAKSSHSTEKLAYNQGQAQKLYTATRTRLRSRFERTGGEIPGIVILISSKGAETAWLEKHKEEIYGKPGVKIVSRAIWDVTKPNMQYSGKRFYVLLGDEFTDSKILDEGEIAPKGAHIVEAPIEYYEAAKEDPETFLRDEAGVATVAVSPLIRRRENIKYIVDGDRPYPFTKREISLSTDDRIQLTEYLNLKDLVTIRGSGYVPKVRSSAYRIIHVDLAESQCSAGFCMGHVYREKEKSMLPKLYIDLILEIKPPEEGVIDFEKIRQFIKHLKQYNFLIGVISYDGYESKDSIQRLRQYFGETKKRKKQGKQAVDIDVLSVDRTDEAYLHAKAFIDNKSCSVYNYYPLISQLISVRHDREKKKVVRGDLLKDVSDAFAGVAYHAATNDRMLYEGITIPKITGV